MKVVLAVKSLLPSYGGPAFSVSRLALALADAGVEMGVWASDRSAAITPLLPTRPSIRRMTGTIVEAMEAFGRPDVLHDNGIWLPHNHRIAELARRCGLPRVVSIRGMLEPWALHHKRVKKKVAWWLYQKRDLCRASYHHATAETEAETLRKFRFGVPVGVIPNGVDIPDVKRERQQRSTRTALFLGRIHPVKGLSLLIESWARARPAGWRLQIAGPDEAGYRAEIESQVSAASLSQAVHFVGPLEGQAKSDAFLNADMFVLPSFSESFAMAVGEALAHGVPVLTTKAVPWPMLANRGCGWSVAPTVDGLIEGLRAATSLGPEALSAMGEKGRELVRQEFSWSGVAKKFVATYETLLSRRDLN